MSLPPDVRSLYSKIIDDILATSDITEVTPKQIRAGIQAAVQYDVTPQKAAIKHLINERFDIFNAKVNGATKPVVEETARPTINGHKPEVKSETKEIISTPPSSASPKRAADTDELSDVGDSSPPKKKRKGDTLDADALYAARLQAEENLRARPTRGGIVRKSAPVKKKKSPTKAKTSKKVKAEDDSDLEGSDGEKKEVNRTGGFHKPMNLSAPLSTLLHGETQLSRPQTVKKLWEYIREHELQDPADRRQIRCDDPMRAVFKQDRIHMFTMTKILNQNLYNPDE